jgi:hypothetical protein
MFITLFIKQGMRSTHRADYRSDSVASRALAARVAHGNSLWMTVGWSQTSKLPLEVRVERTTSMLVRRAVVSSFSAWSMQAGAPMRLLARD